MELQNVENEGAIQIDNSKNLGGKKINLMNRIYFIFCFHKDIWDNGNVQMRCKNNQFNVEELKAIVDESNPLIISKCFSINFGDNPEPPSTKFDLFISLNNRTNWDLSNISLKEKKKSRFIFSEVKIVEKVITNFINYLNSELNLNNINNYNYCSNIDINKRFIIFYNYLLDCEKNKNDVNKNLDKLKENLANDFIYFIKNTKKFDLFFSTAAALFTLCYKNNILVNFLDLIEKLKLSKNEFENESFIKIIEIYENNGNYNVTLNSIFDSKAKKREKFNLEKYKKLLEEFTLNYLLIYKKENSINKGLSLKFEGVLTKLIEKENNMLNLLKSIIDYFLILHNIYLNKKKNYNDKDKILISSKFDLYEITFTEFQKQYETIIKLQIERDHYFIDFSLIIKQYTKQFNKNNDLESLKKMYKIFNYELKQHPKEKDELNNVIHNTGIELFKLGKLVDYQILDFIKSDEIFTTELYRNKKEKDIFILGGININSNNNQILEFIENMQINDKMKFYDCFKNIPDKYINEFTKTIKNIKNFGIFFRILPPKYNTLESAKILNEWLNENISSFSANERESFKEDINKFIQIILSNDGKELAKRVIKFLEDKLGNYCLELFSYITNKNLKIDKDTKTLLIHYFINFNNNEKEFPEIFGIKYFIEHLEREDNIITIFLNEINEYCFKENDFYTLPNNYKYALFKILLNYKKKFIINKHGIYLDNIIIICEKLLDDLKNKNIGYYTLCERYKTIPKKHFIQRIYDLLFFFSKNNNVKEIKKESEEIYENLSKSFLEWEEHFKDLQKIIDYYNKFFSNDNQKMVDKNELFNKIANLKTENISKLISDDIKKKNQIYNNLVKESERYLELIKNSLLFKEIYDSNKLKIINQVSLLNESNKQFLSALKIIKENSDLIQNNENIKYFLQIGYKKEDNLDKEINWLTNYQKINLNEKNKESLLKALKMLVKKESINNLIIGILTLKNKYEEIQENEEEKIYFSDLKRFSDRLKLNISSKEVTEILTCLKKGFNQIDFGRILDFFVTLNKNPDSFNFIKTKKLEEVATLKEFLLDSDNNELTLKDIDEFLKVIRFLNNKISNSKNKTDLINRFISGIANDKECGDCLTNVLIKNNQIQNLFEKFLKGEEGFFKKIKDIIDESQLFINLEEKNKESYIINGYYSKERLNKNKSGDFPMVTSENLDNLYHRACISKKQDINNQNIKIFINFYRDAKKILNLLNELYLFYGFPLEYSITISCKFKKINIDYNNKGGYSCEEFIKHLREIKKNCKSILLKNFSQFEEIRCFYGRQLSLIYRNIKNKTYNNIKDLLFCTSNEKIVNFDENFIYNDEKNENENNIYDHMINTVKNFVKEQLNFNRTTIENVYELNKILFIDNDSSFDISRDNSLSISTDNVNKSRSTLNKQKKPVKGFYFYGSSPTMIEYDILSIYNYFTGKKTPCVNNILFCNKNTSYSEIKTFIDNSIYCRHNNLFILAKPELLNETEKSKFTKYIKLRSKKDPFMMKSCLLIIFNLDEEKIHKLIRRNKAIKELDQEIIAESNGNFSSLKYDNTFVISSKASGLGKSAKINDDNKDREIIYFPIGGSFSSKDLTQRLKKNIPDSFSTNRNYVFHIDISQTTEIELLKDFLFKLLILRKCEINENIRYFGSNVKILIEIPNDFTNYSNEIKILSFFVTPPIAKLKNIKLLSEVKITTTFLSRYENNQIKNGNIRDLERDCNPSQQLCEQLILKYIGIKKSPNYYQINIFARILACEFKKFNECIGFLPESLIENSRYMGMNESEALNLRKYIIGSLIQITKYFTIGPYEELIKSQEKTQKILLGKLDEKENMINEELYLKIDNVSFDKIKPSLVVFNDDKYSVTIITTCDENEEEFKNLEKLYNSQDTKYQRERMGNYRYNFNNLNNRYFLDIDNNFNINNFNNNNFNNNIQINNLISNSISMNLEIKNTEKLQNFRKLDHKNILKILLSFLNVNCGEQEIKNIVGKYVYTPDNFIKIILILLRIRAKVPIIMLGETGCGKTALIDMVSKLKSKGKSTMKILNIHAGTNDEDIISFIDNLKIIVEYEDKKLIKQKEDEYNFCYTNEEKSQYERNRTREEIFRGFKDEITNRKIWVFFDEMNTCNSMGLITEILCKHSMRGEKLNERFVFIAACNPYRIMSKNNIIDNILFHKKAKKKKLVYSVNPLPYTLMNFVFNFGALKQEDEKDYIKSITKESLTSLFKNYDNDINVKNICDDLINFEVESISVAHNHLKENNDVSIVSLREVNRFSVFFKYFVEFILSRKQYYSNNNDEYKIFDDEVKLFYKNKSQKDIYIYAINLSLFICYYLRLPNKKTRNGLVEKLNKINYFNNDFLKVPNIELNYLVDNLEIPKGIAKNKALKENLFSAFNCLVNKIPLVICGKPGRSKTLCIQILNDSLKGPETSKTYLCKKYPELVIHKIQGSLTTTSYDISSTFDKAQKSQDSYKNKLILILMDEMGLAELSSNNPLKVIHSKLEPTDENKKIAFIGISNWALDASKMNRVIYIIVQEPDEEDLLLTAKQIVESYEQYKENYYEKYDNVFKNLTLAYFKYIERKKQSNDENKNFHGSRDFYSLIKTTVRDIIKNRDKLEGNIFNKKKDKDKLLSEICIKNIERNFGGLENSIKEFKEIFFDLYGKENIYGKESEYDVLRCLKENLYDNESRYLLMISDISISKDLLNYLLEEMNRQISQKQENFNENNIINNQSDDEEEEINLNPNNNIKINEDKNQQVKDIKYYSGSKFKLDEDNPFYSDEILNKVKYQMEKDDILILQDLEIVYPALYELFNRSFTHLEGKKFARLGKSQSLSLVNDNFKVIVLVDKSKIIDEDPPFLNRFEKHIISFKNTLDTKLSELADEIFSVLSEIKTEYLKIYKQYKEGKHFNKCSLNPNIKFIIEEEVKGLVYMASKKNLKQKEDIIIFVLEKIVPSFTEDMMVIIEKSDFKTRHEIYYNNIMKIYKKSYMPDINTFLEKTRNEISIIYTFSQITENLAENKKNIPIKNKFFNDEFYLNSFEINNNKKYTKEITMSEILSISEVDKFIIDFLSEENLNLCLFKFKEDDLIKLNDVLNLIVDYKIHKDYNYINEQNKDKKKIFIILIYTQRVQEKITQNVKKEKDTSDYTKYYIPYLSNIQQHFIDNLNNKYNNFAEIISYDNDDLLSKGIKITDLIKNYIVQALRNFSFEFINLNADENENMKINLNINNEKNNKKMHSKKFKSDIIYEIVMNKKHEEVIRKGISKLVKKENNFLKSIFDLKIINKDDYDFMDSLYIYISQQFSIYLIKLLYLFERQQILTCFNSKSNSLNSPLVQKTLNNYIDKIYNVETDKINLGGVNLNNKIEMKILLGIKTPFISKIIEENIFPFIKENISKKYIEKENSIMTRRINPDNIDTEKNNYKSEIKKLGNILMKEIKNYKLMVDILNSGDINLINNLFDDCFLIFLKKSNIFSGNYNLMIELIDIMIQLRLKTRLNGMLNTDFCDEEKIELKEKFIDLIQLKNNSININNINNNGNHIHCDDDSEEEEIICHVENDDNITNEYMDLFVRVLNFIESYSTEIYDILNLLNFAKNYNKNVIKDIKNIIENKEISMGDDDNNLKYSQINKVSFFYCIESLLKVLRNILKQKVDGINKEESIEFFKKIRGFLSNMMKLNKKFLLSSKELYTSQIVIKIINYYEKKKKDDNSLNNIIEIIKVIINEPELILKNNYEELKKSFDLIKQKIEDFGNPNEYKEIMSNMFRNLFIIVKNNKFRKELLEKLVNDEKIVENSYALISDILKNFEPLPLKEGITIKNRVDTFLKFVKDNSEYKVLLNQDKPALTKVILYYFENICENYFNQIKLKNNNNNLYVELCGNLSKCYMEESIKYLKNLEIEETEKKGHQGLFILGKLYSIAYIKRYLINYVNCIIDKNFQKLDERKDINKKLFSEKNLNIIKQIKYYTLKLCLQKLNNNYRELVNYFYNDDDIFEFKIYFDDIEIREKIIYYDPMIPNFDNNLNIDDYISIFHKIKSNTLDENSIDNIINNNETIYTYISNILYENINSYYENECLNIINNELNSMINNLYEKKKFSDSIKNFIKLLINEDQLKETLNKISINEQKNDFPEIPIEKIEILLYSFRFIYGILSSNKTNSFYYKLLSKTIEKTISENLIPGKLIHSDLLIDSFETINDNLKKNPKYGAYLCSCGYHYSIGQCTFPMAKFKCPKCNEIIGGQNHKLHKRPGHRRVFFDENTRNYLNRIYPFDINMSYIYLSDLEKEVNQKKNQMFKGLKPESEEVFLEKSALIRGMTYITFRILHFILYTCIFYSNITGNINDNKLKQYLINNMTCFEIMEADWGIINEELMEKQGTNIQTFMNIIYNKLLNILLEPKNIENEKVLNDFEKRIDEMIKKEIENKEAIENYKNQKTKLLNITKETESNIAINSDKVIITERIDVKLISNKYPDMKYFFKSKLPVQDFKTKFLSSKENKDYYPIINYIIESDSRLKYLNHLPIFNELCNYMIKYCSYKFTRDEAKKKKILNEIPTKKELINNFILAYKELRNIANQYQCHAFEDKNKNKMFIDLENDDYMSNFCVDTGEFNYGMVLFAIYQELINLQNGFINLILNSKNINHKYYSELFEQEILIQKCSQNDLLNLPSINDVIFEIVLKNSKQKSFNVIEYNNDAIEDELASKILPSIKKFSNSENDIKCVIYQFEGFRGNKSSIITDFITKYQTKNLSNNEDRNIKEFIKENQIYNNKKNADILFSLQILIDIILENNCAPDDKISNIVKENVKTEKIEDLEFLFNKNENISITVDKLMNIFNLFETACWENIKNNLDISYKKEIDNKIKTKLTSWCNNYKYNIDNANENKLINPVNLSTAIRRFISRYLCGKRGMNEINENNNIYYYLGKQELWDESNFVDNDVFDNELSIIFDVNEQSRVKIIVGQAFAVYTELGGDNTKIEEMNNEIKDNDKRPKINENKEKFGKAFEGMKEMKDIQSDDNKSDSSNKDDVSESNNDNDDENDIDFDERNDDLDEF